MRAWQVHAAGEPRDVMRLVEVAPPEPGPGQVRVRVTAAGIGLPDVFMCRGVYPLTPALPFTAGQEATGIVTAVGDGVAIQVGAKVMGVTMFYLGHGSFAEECLMMADTVFPVPVGLSDARAAGFWIPHLTVWVGLVDRAGLRAGEELAVLGAAGGSGIAAVQLGKALGARVIAIVGGDDRAEFCRGLGADETLDHRGGPLAPRLRASTGGRGVDVIYDPVGGEPAEDARRGLARFGRLLAVGFASGRWPRIDTHELVTTNTSLLGVFAGGYSRAELDAIHAHLGSLIAAGRLRDAVTEEIPFEDLAERLQEMSDRSVLGKRVVVLR